MVDVNADVITLADGRRLSWYEYGDPAGLPVIYTAGTPVSGLGGAAYDDSESSGHDVGVDRCGEITSRLAAVAS